MTDNVLKGVVDAIAESNNEIGGQLVTRLREVADFGRNDGSVLAASPTVLTSPIAVFSASWAGLGIDILTPPSGTPTGNEGSYIVSIYVNPTNITLDKIDGSAATFVDQNPVRWRVTTLKAETTFEFPDRDRRLQLWVGDEPTVIPYAELVPTVGSQEFRGIGAHQTFLDGSIDSAAPTTLSTTSVRFSASDVGSALWILPAATANGNEGPQLITAVASDGKSVTVSPGGLTTTEADVRFSVKSYNESGYLTKSHRELSEIIDASGSYSALDQLRRSMLVAYATEEELDRIGRNLSVSRLPGMQDEIYRCLLQTLSYLPKATVYGLELVLDCLFPGESWEVYEDLVSFPNNVFILLPVMSGDSVIFEGKAFLAPTGSDVVPPIAVSALGKGSREAQTSASTTSVSVDHTPITVVDVLLDDAEQTLAMGVLPSADSPVWTYDNQGDIEANVFSVSGGTLSHTQAGPTITGGAYYRDVTTMDNWEGSYVEMEAFWRADTLTTVGGRDWHMAIYDDAIDKEYALYWDDTDFVLATLPRVVKATGNSAGNHADGEWHHIRLRRTSKATTHVIEAWVDGESLFGEVDSSLFSSTALERFSFGYFDLVGATQDWTVEWDDVRVFTTSTRNYWNISRLDGVFSGANNNLSSASALFVAGDVNKRVRIRSEGTGSSEVVGLWNISAYVSATEVTLEGILSGNIATVTEESGSNFVDLLDPWFVEQDVGKEIEMPSAALGTNSTPRTVLEYVNQKRVRVDGAAYVSEQELSYRFNPSTFPAATSVSWELIDASSFAATTLTLRDALPSASEPVNIWYTSVLSAQILRNEFVTNEGSAGSAGNIYYPFYVFDVDRATRQLMDEITAAGVIPEYEREF